MNMLTLRAGDLVLSFVSDAEQPNWRDLTRTRYQLVVERGRIQSQVENPKYLVSALQFRDFPRWQTTGIRCDGPRRKNDALGSRALRSNSKTLSPSADNTHLVARAIG